MIPFRCLIGSTNHEGPVESWCTITHSQLCRGWMSCTEFEYWWGITCSGWEYSQKFLNDQPSTKSFFWNESAAPFLFWLFDAIQGNQWASTHILTIHLFWSSE